MRKLYKETKHLRFYITDKKPKTVVMHVINKSHQHLGIIMWHAPWRQYTWNIMTDEDVGLTFNDQCLKDIADVLATLNTLKKDNPFTHDALVAGLIPHKKE